jgi:hypothetical protein
MDIFSFCSALCALLRTRAGDFGSVVLSRLHASSGRAQAGAAHGWAGEEPLVRASLDGELKSARRPRAVERPKWG